MSKNQVRRNRILDRAGYYAEWIHDRMSAQDETDIEHECVMYISQRGEV